MKIWLSILLALFLICGALIFHKSHANDGTGGSMTDSLNGIVGMFLICAALLAAAITWVVSVSR